MTDDEWRLASFQCHYNSSLLSTYAYVSNIDDINPISALRYTAPTNDDDSSSPMIPCDRFDFDFSYFGPTIVSKWNLVCDRYSLRSVVEMCFLAGAAVGSLCSGWVSDKYGRRHTLMILSATQNVIGKNMFYLFLRKCNRSKAQNLGFTGHTIKMLFFKTLSETN